MADAFDALLQAFALQEAQKAAIAQASPYAGFQQGAGTINQAILSGASNPNFGTGEKIAAGLIGGLIGGGVDYLNEDWTSRAQDEYRSALMGGFNGAPAERDLLPRSIWDTAEDQGKVFKMKSIWDAQQQDKAAERELETYAKKKGADLVAEREKLLMEKPWLRELSPAAVRADAPGEETQAIATQIPAGGADSDRERVMQGLRIGEFNSPAEGYKFLRDQAEAQRQRDEKALELERQQEKDTFSTEDSFRKEIARLPSVTQFQAMQRSLPLVESFKDQDTRSSDIGFVYNFVKALDEGAVRGEELALAGTANPIIQAYAERIQGAFTGESELTPELKNQMYGELLGARGGVYNAAKQDAGVLAQIAKQRGVTAVESLYPFDTALDFSTKPTGANLEMRLAQGFQSGGMSGALQELAKEYPQTPEGRAQFKAAAPQVMQLLSQMSGGQ